MSEDVQKSTTNLVIIEMTIRSAIMFITTDMLQQLVANSASIGQIFSYDNIYLQASALT